MTQKSFEELEKQQASIPRIPSIESPMGSSQKGMIGSSYNSSDPHNLSRARARLESHGIPCVRAENHLFIKCQGIISPAAPASEPVDCGSPLCRRLVRELGGTMVRWTSGFAPNNRPAEWYSVICRKFVPLEELPHRKRYKIKRSLKACEARIISAGELAAAGYPVLLKAIKRYKGPVPSVPTEEQFRTRLALDSQFPDLVQHWGVYHQNTLIGYTQILIVGGTEVGYSSTKLDPDYFKYDPGYAVVYRMLEHYLGRGGYQYVNDGFRSVYHETNMQSFLMENFGFEKAYTKLHLYYRSPLGLLMRLGYPYRNLLGRMDRRLAALFEQERCRRFS